MKNNDLSNAGINIPDLLKRLMGNSKLIPVLMQKFLQDTSITNLQNAINNDDMDRAAREANAIKGLCGNLSLQHLAELFDTQLQLFRSGDTEKAASMMPQINSTYEKTVDSIKKQMNCDNSE